MKRAAGLYLDSSAALRAVLERGASPALARRIRRARLLVTSRLSLVESARALLRLRVDRLVPENRLADASRELETLWARCEVWELTRTVCELAGRVAPHKVLRTLDALHLATYVLARRQIEGLELVTTDRRLEDAAGSV